MCTWFELDDLISFGQHGGQVCYNMVPPSPLHGTERSRQLLRNCEIDFLEEARRGAEERHQELQGGCADVNNVEMVRDLYFLTVGNRERT